MASNQRKRPQISNKEILQSDVHYLEFLKHLGKRYPNRALAAVAAWKIVDQYAKSKPELNLNYELSQDWDYGTNIVKLLVTCRDCDIKESTDHWNEICFQVYRDVRDLLEISQKRLAKLMHYISIQVEEGEYDDQL